MTFYDFLKRHFEKNIKSRVFSKYEKNVKYVFSNTDLNWIQVFVDCVFGSPVIVGSPVEVELRQIVVGRQTTGRDANQIIVVLDINLNCSHQITYASY